jgi:acetylglutamate kinase
MRLTVLKVGGAALARAPFRLADHVETGEEVVVVHGAGGRIDAALRRAGIESTFVGGRRVTPPEAMRHVKAAFAEENRGLCRQIGPSAVGLLGDELGLEAERLPELGAVGHPLAFAPPRLRQLVREGRIPVVASLARGPLNVNADDAAAALARALHADRLVFVSDVDGVHVAGAVAEALAEGDVAEALDRGELTGGIVPKLEAALAAARDGIETHVGSTQLLA